MRFRNCFGMIWSVSTLTRSSGTAMPVSLTNGSIVNLLKMPQRLFPVADVDEMPGDGGGGGHLRADEMRASAPALAPLEVAVRGRGAALTRLEDVRVHAQTHRAARLAPVETGLLEDPVQPLRFGLLFDRCGAGDDHRM